jgi:transposase
MSRRKRETDPLPPPTIWRVSDELWAKIEAVLNQYDPDKPVGRKRIDQRRALDAILYRMRTGVQ